MPNLHSTMLLLYRWPVFHLPVWSWSFTFHYASTLSTCRKYKGRLESSIYIPLCFYFIGKASGGSQVLLFIYIPLCFYFIVEQLALDLPKFNLHSTMLLLYPVEERLPIPNKEIIYIPLCFYFIQGSWSRNWTNVNLHSTMLLLYLVSVIFDDEII